ncbi:MAG: ATP-binding cassette domain-containing protein [Candidatus Methanoperedens sp.]|nr:ATP-binding cassette domain-containing protein [Candidatus Methanoperedens sp.]
MVIKTESLTKKYGKITAVEGLNLDIEEGEIFGLLGPNGAGKTTLISMLCTILKPTEIHWNSIPGTKRGRPAYRTRESCHAQSPVRCSKRHQETAYR